MTDSSEPIGSPDAAGSGPSGVPAAADPDPAAGRATRRRASAAARRSRAAAARVRSSARWRFGLAALASGVLFWVVYWVFVLTESGQRLENIALMGAQLRRDTVREETLGYLSQITVLSFFVAILAIAGVAFLRRRPGLGVLVAGAMGASAVVAELLKDVLPRPELVTGPIWILRPDFPSGTATIAVAVGIGALLVAPDRLRWFVLPVVAIVAAVIGQSTQIAGWHRLSSAVGGVLVVLTAASVAILLLNRAGLVQPSPLGRIHRRIRLALLVVPGGAFVIAALVLALLLAFPLLQRPRDADAVFLHTAFELFGFGLTIVAFVVFARLIEPFTLGRSGPVVAAAGSAGAASRAGAAGRAPAEGRGLAESSVIDLVEDSDGAEGPTDADRPTDARPAKRRGSQQA